MTGPDIHGSTGERWSGGPNGSHHVELVGAHLRVRGWLALGRFPRLSDLINHNRGFLVLHDAELLDRTGQVIGPGLTELVVNQDEITFVGHDAPAEEAGQSGSAGFVRHFVAFMPAHTVSGLIHFHREMTLASFVEATDPRFLSMGQATARSLLDQRVVARYGHLLVNRTQINAIAETDGDVILDVRPTGAGTAPEGIP